MKIVLVIVTVFSTVICFGQKENKQIAAGNRAYQKGDFKTAATNYQQALKVNPKNETAKYNLANALVKQEEQAQAEKIYEDLGKNGRKGLQSDAYYNNGVSQVRGKDLKGAISSFENSLRRDPNDQMARENLQKAINDLKQQQQQQKQNQQQKQDNKQDQQQQKPQESPKEQQNKKDMDKLLKQLSEQEKDLQKKLQQQQQQNRKQPEKDW